MKTLKRRPLLAALFALALLAGGVGVVQAQQADPAPPDASDAPCPMMGEDGTMDMEGMDMQAMMEACPMMSSTADDGGGMMGMMSMMKDCPMMKQMMKDCPMMGGMMDGTAPSGSAAHGAMHGMDRTDATPAQAVVTDGVQTAAVTVGPGGFSPREVRLEAGVPARLVFTRTTDGTCATEVQVPDLGVPKTALPLDEPVAVTFTPEEAGTYAFTCGMGMMRGTLVVTQ